MDKFACPRRGESFVGSLETSEDKTPDHWRADHSCSYCGSLNPEIFMARVEAGTAEVGPTDKSYKVYVKNAGGEPFKQTFRNCPRDARCTGPDDCDHWVTQDVEQTKFYLQHLSAAGREAFINLYNGGKMKMGYPGHFYVSPFFARSVREG